MTEVDNISADLFKDILIDQEIPVDIFDFFEEKSCEQLNKLSSCIRKSVIQRLPRMVDKSRESKVKCLKYPLIFHFDLEICSERRIETRQPK